MAKSRRSGTTKHRKTKKSRLNRRKMKGGSWLPDSWFKKPYEQTPSNEPKKTWKEYLFGQSKVAVEDTHNPINESITNTSKSDDSMNKGENVYHPPSS